MAQASRASDPVAPPSDPLGEALHFLRMTGAFYCRSELSAPWGIGVPPMAGCIWFHVVTEGHCTVEVDGAEPRTIRPGDLALVPHGAGHVLLGEPGVATPDVLGLDRELVSERYELLRHGGGGEPTTLICGAVRFDHPAARTVVDLLPPALVLDSASAEVSEWMRSTLRLIAAEARSPMPGGEAVITRLADILVIQAIRAWIERDPAARTGWLGALSDPQVGPALARIHRDPARPWTVASLADQAAMSRSAFAARFTELVGEPAMQYVTRWRMHLASDALREGGVTVGELADRFGYRSEAAFSRAFKRVVGSPPGAVRRAGEAPAVAA